MISLTSDVEDTQNSVRDSNKSDSVVKISRRQFIKTYK